jgi:hypothetical protein
VSGDLEIRIRGGAKVFEYGPETRGALRRLVGKRTAQLIETELKDGGVLAVIGFPRRQSDD